MIRMTWINFQEMEEESWMELGMNLKEGKYIGRNWENDLGMNCKSGNQVVKNCGKLLK